MTEIFEPSETSGCHQKVRLGLVIFSTVFKRSISCHTSQWLDPCLKTVGTGKMPPGEVLAFHDF